MAWLRGRFLARGSLSLANGRTHLELVVTPEEAPIVEGLARVLMNHDDGPALIQVVPAAE